MSSGVRRVKDAASSVYESSVSGVKAAVGQGETGNIFKDLAASGVDMSLGPTAALTRAVGLEGVSGGVDKLSGTMKGLGGLTVDMATGEHSKDKQKMKDQEAAATRQYQSAQQARVAAAAESARQAEDAARIKEGTSKSNTLLTGGMGLEDDEDSSISRRFLTGR